jgi:hypothetical protein
MAIKEQVEGSDWKHIILTNETKQRFDMLKGVRKKQDPTADQFLNTLLDLWEATPNEVRGGLLLNFMEEKLLEPNEAV